jgi:hypothetical protein
MSTGSGENPNDEARIPESNPNDEIKMTNGDTSARSTKGQQRKATKQKEKAALESYFSFVIQSFEILV